MKNHILTWTRTHTIRTRAALAHLIGGCVHCGASGARSVLSPRLCQTCINTISGQDALRCHTCAVLLHTHDVNCLACLTAPPLLQHVSAYGDYVGVLQHLILNYKFHAMLHAAPALADILQARLRVYASTHQPNIIIPVPQFATHTTKRGFVPLVHLLRQVDITQLWAQVPAVESATSIRIHQPHLQVSSTPTQRRNQIKNAFAITRDLTGQHVLLIDDVYTTGATLNEMARECLVAGAKRVDALVLARARKVK